MGNFMMPTSRTRSHPPPFATFNQTGVGLLMQIAVEKGRASRGGICGEHGGDPDSVKFCHCLGLTT